MSKYSIISVVSYVFILTIIAGCARDKASVVLPSEMRISGYEYSINKHEGFEEIEAVRHGVSDGPSFTITFSVRIRETDTDGYCVDIDEEKSVFFVCKEDAYMDALKILNGKIRAVDSLYDAVYGNKSEDQISTEDNQ